MPISCARHGRRALLSLLALVACLSGVLAAQAAPRPVRVMTRNLYLGTDLTPVLTAQTVPAFLAATTAVWQQVQATDFPARAKVLANEIVASDPTLVGLQEAAMWRTGPAFNPAPATNVVYDFIISLQSELAALGVPYDLVKQQEEADLEAPTLLGVDVRLTQRDAILVKHAAVASSEVTLSNAQSASFPPGPFPAGHTLVLTSPATGATFPSTRGWVSVDATVNKRSFRFVTTHLEAFSATYRALQAGDLLTGPTATMQKVILVGDLNSDPNDCSVTGLDPTANCAAYVIVTQNGGFADTESTIAAGDTCCHAADLLNPVAEFDERIDHVLYRGTATVSQKQVTGDDVDNRTPSDLWPSDHGGVITALTP